MSSKFTYQDLFIAQDDFRALLEAAEKDERNTSRKTAVEKSSTSQGRKRGRQPSTAAERKANKATAAPQERKRPKMKDYELTRYLDENFASLNDGLGVMPKYRAKNRLRSIIKRKPGTQDTDLMSNNVEILGGRVDKQTVCCSFLFYP